MIRKTFEIPKSNIGILKKEFKKLYNRTRKIHDSGEFDIVAPTFEIIGEIKKEIRDENDRKVKIDCFVVEITGETPKFKGWTFVSTLDHRNDGTTIIKNIPDEETPERFRETGCSCDHCGVNRFRRKTFVVHHDNGSYMQVGSTCVKDFLGGKTPEQIAKIAEWWGNIDGFGSELDGIPREEFYYGITDVLSRTSAIINDIGWTPRSRSGETSSATADIVFTWFVSKDFEKYYGKKLFVEEFDIETAKKAIEWCLNLENKEKLNDYEYNIVTLAKSDNIRGQDFGLACSIVGSYVNHINRRVEAEKGCLKESEFFGEIKTRYELDNVEVIFVKKIEGYYGMTTIVKMIMEEGNLITWFATNDPDISVGEKHNIRATVKKHNDYNGVKETIVTRVFFKKEKK